MEEIHSTAEVSSSKSRSSERDDEEIHTSSASSHHRHQMTHAVSSGTIDDELDASAFNPESPLSMQESDSHAYGSLVQQQWSANEGTRELAGECEGDDNNHYEAGEEEDEEEDSIDTLDDRPASKPFAFHFSKPIGDVQEEQPQSVCSSGNNSDLENPADHVREHDAMEGNRGRVNDRASYTMMPVGNDDEEEEEEQEMSYTDEILSSFESHLFILTGAGKPIYSRHGDPNRMNDIFGLLQLLYNMRRNNNSNSQSRNSPIPDDLYQIEYGRRTLYFYCKDDIIYIKALSRGGESSASSDLNDKNFISVVRQQLQLLHYYLLSVIPGLDHTLRNSPNYDVGSQLTESDLKMLTLWVERTESQIAFAFHTVSIVPLHCSLRSWLEAEVTAVRRECLAGSANYLYTFILFQSQVVTVCSPPKGKYKPQKEDYTNCGLGTTDMSLVMHMVEVSMSRQVCGQSWAPICLPFFNKSGYIWCHVSNLSSLVRESEHPANGASTPQRLHGDKGILMVHLTAGDGDFPVIQTAVEALGHRILRETNKKEKFYALEKELLENSEEHEIEDGETNDSVLIDSKGWVRRLLEFRTPLLWFSTTVGSESAFAAPRPKDVPFVTGSLQSSKHPFYFISSASQRDDQYRRVLGHLCTLRSMPSAPSSLPLLLVQEDDYAAVLLRPTSALVTLLCQQFYNPKELGPSLASPTKANSPKKWGFKNFNFWGSSKTKAVPSPNEDHSGDEEEESIISSFPPKKPYEFKKILLQCQATVGDLVCIFPPGSEKDMMLSWATFLLIQVNTQCHDLIPKEICL